MDTNFFLKVDIKKGYDDNVISISKQLLTEVERIILKNTKIDFDFIDKYFPKILKTFGINDFYLEHIDYKNLNNSIYSQAKFRLKEDFPDKLKVFQLYFDGELKPKKRSNQNDKFYFFFIPEMDMKKWKKIEKNTKAYYINNPEGSGRLIYRAFPFLSIMELYLSFLYLSSYDKILKTNLTNSLCETYGKKIKENMESFFFNYEPWGNFSKIKLVLPIHLNKDIKTLIEKYINSGIGDMYSDKSLVSNGNLKDGRKENAKVYQKTNLKSNDDTETIMKEQVLGMIDDTEIKNIINMFGGFEIDKDTDLKSLHLFFSGYIKLLKTIQKTLPFIDIYKDLLPKVFFKVRKLGQHKASGLYYPQNKVMAVDVKGFNSVIHETGHMVHFGIAEYIGNNKIIDILSNLCLMNLKKNIELSNLKKYINIYKSLSKIYSFGSIKNKVITTPDKLGKYIEQKDFIIKTIGKGSLFEKIKKEKIVTLYEFGPQVIEYGFKQLKTGEIEYFERKLNINKGYKRGITKLKLELEKNITDEEFIKLRKVYSLVASKSNGKYSFTQYVLNNTELFARLFDYYICYIVGNDKGITEKEKGLLLKDMKKNGRDGLIEKLDFELLKLIGFENVFKDFGILLANLDLKS